MEKIARLGVFLVVMLLLYPWLVNSSVTTSNSISPPIARKGCNDTCGNISVPYPFGIGDSTCAMNPYFQMTCNYSFNPPQLTIGYPVVDMSVEEGTLVLNIPMAYMCFNSTGEEEKALMHINLTNTPYTLSNTSNRLTVVGCNTAAYMVDSAGSFGSGCLSFCSEPVNLKESKSCSGIGCCQTDIRPKLKTLNISIGIIVNQSTEWQFNPCKYAFLTDVKTFNVSNLQLSDNPTLSDDSSSSLVLEWVAEAKKCEEAQGNATSYACKDNAYCSYSDNGQGYRCLCKEGFMGNPYLDACQDIDECKDPVKYPCKGTCKNTWGNYTCRCPIGMHGDGKISCQGFRLSTVASVVGAIIFVTIISILSFIMLKKRRKENNFLRNGGTILKHQRVRIFSEAELAKATRNYDSSQLLGQGGFGSVYKGLLADNIQVAVKKPKELSKAHLNQEFQQEISIVSQVNHKNVVKLLGLCLETKVPLLVYEFVSDGTLYEHIQYKRSQILTSWKNRLKIAAEAALAFDYLHSLADPPIIHGDVKSTNILLDDSHTVKVSDFGASVLISPSQTDIAFKIQGTFGYLDPEYLMTGELTTKSDVYSFGIVLLELLTGMRPNFGLRNGEKGSIVQNFMTALENNDLSQVLCFRVQIEGEMEEIEVFAEIAKKCIDSSGIKRPTMKQVAEELVRLTKMNESLWATDDEETQRLLNDTYMSSPDNATSKMSKVDTDTMSTFGLEFYSDSI